MDIGAGRTVRACKDKSPPEPYSCSRCLYVPASGSWMKSLYR